MKDDIVRNLMVCCDGTWNTPDQEKGGVPAPTNVVRLYNCAVEDDKQLRYYHPGVGTEGGILEKALGGSMGYGLSKNIMSAYKWLVDNYQTGDKIFLFGFSRGAFTVRSLGGMIVRRGLLSRQDLSEKEVWERVKHLYDMGYRKGQPESIPKSWNFHQETPASNGVTIHFIGVWDTVGALGIPDDLALLNLIDEQKRYGFHDTQLSDKVTHARHAVAIDERRASFAPTLWTNVDGRQNVKQVWFPGVHSDIGGGYPEKGLSDGTLNWMIEEATHKAIGLRVHAAMVKSDVKPDYRDVLHDSVTGGFKLLRTHPRSIPRIKTANDFEVHKSAVERQKLPPITQAPYRPTWTVTKSSPRTVRVYAMDPWNATGIYLEAGQTYQFSATGEWVDGLNIACGPGGTHDGNFHIGEIAHLAGTLFGKAENLYKNVTGNPKADFKATRREENIPWMGLVGVIANGKNPHADGTPDDHQTFFIGNGVTERVERSGYLHCYANDAWGFYENNRGSVELLVILDN